MSSPSPTPLKDISHYEHYPQSHGGYLLPPSFEPGPKINGKYTFHKTPEREAFDKRWREAVARGEDPKLELVRKLEMTGSSSFIEKGWRKVRGKKGTRAQERVAEERREREREERGESGLLKRGGEEGGVLGGGGEEGKKEGKGKWHDRLRWGI